MSVFFRLSVSLLALLLTSAASAASQFELTNTQARATFPMAETAAVYTTILNHSDQPVTLVRASVSEDLAAQVQIHTTVMQDGMMKMRQLKDGVTVAPGESVAMQSGGTHFMLTGLVSGLEAGSAFPMTLYFSDGSEQKVTVPVVNASETMHHHHHGNHH